MSETPTPSKSASSGKGPAKRGGLALPPRGQALARLQDLEEEGEPNAVIAEDLQPTEGSNAVNTACSNAVPHQGSISVQSDHGLDQASVSSSEATMVPPQTNQPTGAAAPKVAADYQAPARAVREPTTRITVDMPDSLHQKISVLSAQTRRSIKDLVIEALAATYFGTGKDNP